MNHVTPKSIRYGDHGSANKRDAHVTACPWRFAATWTGGLLAPRYGVYRLQVEAPGEFRVRGMDNLFVCDASVFPSSIRVNPQWTIMSVADYAVRHIGDVTPPQTVTEGPGFELQQAARKKAGSAS